LLAPSSLAYDDEHGLPEAMNLEDIQNVIEEFRLAARRSREAGFDGIEIHAAHGYLIDQFFNPATNHRTDAYGGDITGRTRFGAEIVRAIRRRTAPDFPIVLRYSQWKLHDHGARPFASPDELARLLGPLVDAGVDAFDCSTRRYWEPEFEGSPLNLAGWTKKLTGLPTITVGSVTLANELMSGLPQADTTGIDDLLDRLAREEFDLVAVGRALIANPAWATIIRTGELHRLQPYDRRTLSSLV